MSTSTVTSFDFMPHGHCFYWQKDILLLHVVSDALIALAYFSIPFALVYLSKKRPDLGFRRLFIMFAAFILACGITHLMNIWNFWYADYWLSGFAKSATAIVSLVTAFMLWRLMPRVVDWPSPALLKQKNQELQDEIMLRKEQEVQLQEAFDNAPIGKALVGLNGTWIKVNPALCNILGYSESELTNMNFQQITFEEDLDADLNNVYDLINGVRDSYQMEKRYKHKAGHLVWALLSVTIVREDTGNPRYFIAQILDITYRKLAESELQRARAELETRVAQRTRELETVNHELQEKNAQLKHLSTTDALTQLSNRHVLNAEIEKLCYDAERYNSSFCVMLIDVDNFKQINDTHGHMQGDDVIREIGKLLKTHLRHTDIAARFGGDEFCVLLPHMPLGQAPEIADKFRQRIETETFETDNGERFTVTVSIGIAEYNSDLCEPKALLALADEALYIAKEKGRNRVEIKG